jgi:LPS sulfotransferase NodH
MVEHQWALRARAALGAIYTVQGEGSSVSISAAEWLSPSRDFATPGAVTRRYAILSAPRSGSTLLGESLRSTGVAGDPIEYLHPNLLRAFLQREPRHYSEWQTMMAAMELRRTSPNGVFGSKLHFEQFTALFGPAINDVGARWLAAQGALVRIYRQDKLAQAVSRLKAVATGKWHSSHSQERTFSFIGTPEEFLELVGHMDVVIAGELMWRMFCARHGLATLDISYEELTGDLQGTVGKVLRYIGVAHPPAQIAQPALSKLADDESARLRGELLRFLTGEGSPV